MNKDYDTEPENEEEINKLRKRKNIKPVPDHMKVNLQHKYMKVKMENDIYDLNSPLNSPSSSESDKSIDVNFLFGDLNICSNHIKIKKEYIWKYSNNDSTKFFLYTKDLQNQINAAYNNDEKIFHYNQKSKFDSIPEFVIFFSTMKQISNIGTVREVIKI